MEQFLTAESVQALQQLFEINLQLYKPEVAEWLHSEEAEPLLSQILVNVPCSVTLH